MSTSLHNNTVFSRDMQQATQSERDRGKDTDRDTLHSESRYRKIVNGR